MKIPDALFDAVAETPDEDAPREAVAAFLEEHGDPRGEFIRLQLARAKAGDPPSEREKELLAEHRDAWLSPLENVEHAYFERGFLDYLEFRGGAGTRARGKALNDRIWSTVRALPVGLDEHPLRARNVRQITLDVPKKKRGIPWPLTVSTLVKIERLCAKTSRSIRHVDLYAQPGTVTAIGADFHPSWTPRFREAFSSIATACPNLESLSVPFGCEFTKWPSLPRTVMFLSGVSGSPSSEGLANAIHTAKAAGVAVVVLSRLGMFVDAGPLECLRYLRGERVLEVWASDPLPGELKFLAESDDPEAPLTADLYKMYGGSATTSPQWRRARDQQLRIEQRTKLLRCLEDLDEERAYYAANGRNVTFREFVASFPDPIERLVIPRHPRSPVLDRWLALHAAELPRVERPPWRDPPGSTVRGILVVQ